MRVSAASQLRDSFGFGPLLQTDLLLMTQRETSHLHPDKQHDTVESGESNPTSEDLDANASDSPQADAEDRRDLFATFLPADGRPVSRQTIRYDALVRGDQIGDFRIQRLLGRGSFGAVYLARELTLDRLVAVKVVLPEGQHATKGEGRSLAQLKHPGIVGVYGEAHDPVSGCALLWMQYVDGTNLASLIGQLHHDDRGDWNESTLTGLIAPDSKSTATTAVPATARRDDCSPQSLETVCRIGIQLAESLAHAHECGITHRDIKPANILMQRDATPLLADFNMAGNESSVEGNHVSGGTIAYMPPERLENVLGKDSLVDERRADIYSLGVVLWELACGQRPHAEPESSLTSSGGQLLQELLQVRRQETSPTGGIPIGLAMVLGRAMCVDPQQRYPSARAMATALSGLEQLERARRRAAAVSTGMRHFARRNLIWIIMIGGILPHVAASGLQSAYNQIWVRVTPDTFFKAFIAYNVVVYPACAGWVAWKLFKFAQGYRRVLAGDPIPRGHLRKLRGRLLKLPRQFMIASAVGWFPGALLFPWLLSVFGQSPSPNQWLHYAISFTIAGLIATTYSYAFVLYVVVCHGYRVCWQTASQYRSRAREELTGLENQISWVAIFAGVLPLAAAVLLLAMGIPSLQQPDTGLMEVDQLQEEIKLMADHEAQMRSLHTLVMALIVLGAIGLYAVERASARLLRVVRALTLAD